MAQAKKAELQSFLDQRATGIKARLNSFAKTARLFFDHDARFIDKYEDKWVAAYDGEIVAVGDSLGDVMRELATKEIPAADTMIRRIDRKEKTLIL